MFKVQTYYLNIYKIIFPIESTCYFKNWKDPLSLFNLEMADIQYLLASSDD